MRARVETYLRVNRGFCAWRDVCSNAYIVGLLRPIRILLWWTLAWESKHPSRKASSLRPTATARAYQNCVSASAYSSTTFAHTYILIRCFRLVFMATKSHYPGSLMETTPALIPGFQDILYHILSHLTPDPKVPSVFLEGPADSKSARNALACLARAHTIFTRPALAVMWRSLPSQGALEHLLCVLELARRPPWPPEQQDRPPLVCMFRPNILTIMTKSFSGNMRDTCNPRTGLDTIPRIRLTRPRNYLRPVC